MTVIIAGLHSNGKGAIIVSDRLRTGTDPVTKQEFRVQHDEVVKIHRLNKSIVYGHSGNVEFWSEILKEVESQINNNSTFKQVRKVIEESYRPHFIRYLEARVLVTYGFPDMKSYVSQIGDLPPRTVDRINAELRTTFADGELIVIGTEDGNLYEIYTLSDPGVMQPNKSGFTIVGSGRVFGQKVLQEDYRPSMTMEELEKLLLKSKKLAEADQHVGDMTQIERIG